MSAIAGFTITKTLFQSRRTIIYRARRDADGQAVILKSLNTQYPTSEQIARMHREYRITQRVQTEGVIRTFGLEKHDTNVTIVLEDFGAHASSALIAQSRVLLPDFLKFALWLTKTIGHVHRCNVIHKDINPSNIVWERQSNVFKLIDFGLATELSSENQTPQNLDVLEGTLPYISPEATGRINRAVDYRSDFYSMGVTFYQLLTGVLPFTSADPMELVHGHIAVMPVAPSNLCPDVPAVISQIVLRLLAKRPEERYQSSRSLFEDLEKARVYLETSGTIPMFSLGWENMSERFLLPQKLYGREQERSVLLDAFERVRDGRKEILLVSGYSGVGKTSLVRELFQQIAANRGYFISGKFDQFSRNVPYAPLVQAFQELVRQVLTEPAARLAQWQTKLTSALGTNAQVIIEAINEARFILGEQPPLPALPPKEAENRFKLTFESFVRMFAAKEHPLVIFLDDLQWADLSSLSLIERLMGNSEMKHFLLIGSYRDNEVGPGHPLLATLSDLRQATETIGSITLRPLELNHCVEFCADTLRAEPNTVEPLARLCIQKTQGNPFFLSQFLLALHTDGVFRYDEHGGRWTWDIEQVRLSGITENVVDLMTSKLQRLSSQTQRALTLAACIGNTFELATLAIIDAASPVEASARLWPALEEGLVLPLGEQYKLVEEGIGTAPEHTAQIAYRFLHDRVQQAAYALTPKDERQKVHLEIGRLLLRSVHEQRWNELLFTIANHLHEGFELVTDASERQRIAEIFLEAGKKAKASAAHAAAMMYFNAGLAGVGKNGFSERYELTLALHVEIAEAYFLCGDHEAMERHASQVIEKARHILDSLKVYETRIQAYTTQNRFTEALELSRHVLNLLGLELPTTPSMDDIQTLLTEVRTLIGERTVASLIDLPAMTDPIRLAMVRILVMAIPTSYIAQPMLLPIVAMRVITLSILSGNTGASSCGYTAFGIFLCGALEDMDQGNAFGALGVRIVEQFNAKEYEGRARFMVSSFIRHWKDSARKNWELFREIYHICLATGDIDLAGYAANGYVADGFTVGVDLPTIADLAVVYTKATIQLKHDTCTHWNQIVHQVTENLMLGSKDPCHISGAICKEEELIELYRHTSDTFGMGNIFVFKTLLCFLFERYAEAAAYAEATVPCLDGMVSSIFIPQFHLYRSLSLLNVCGELSGEDRVRALQQIDESLEKFQRWSQSAPMNHAHRYWLVEAERARIADAHDKAREYYVRAMDLAKKHEYVHEEAVAAELYAKFLLNQGESDVAGSFIKRAHHLYGLWGAKAKVRHIEMRYSLYLAEPESDESPANAFESTASRRLIGAAGALDLISVLRASQALSEEVVVTELLRKVMRIVLQNAGARRGFLFLEGDPPLKVEASGETILFHPTNGEKRADIAQSIVRYVRRTRELVVIGDATAGGLFQSDPHIQNQKTKSILCLPLVRQRSLTAILYLEHELIANVFTPERCRVLELLSSQMAISIENARLYETLDQRVKDRTATLSKTLDDLRKTQQRLIQSEKMASMGRLSMGIAHELKNPLNFVINFAEFGVELADDLEQTLAGIQGQPASALEDARSMVEELKSTAGDIRRHSGRANDIIQSMMSHAGGGTDNRRTVDLNELVEGSTRLLLNAPKRREYKDVVKIERGYDETIGGVTVAPQDMTRVLLNILENAFDAVMSSGAAREGSYTPTIAVYTQREGDTAIVRIRDNGPGISTDILPRIFEPFFTTKPTGTGIGLGLSVAYDIVVHGHHGAIVCESSDRTGTTFVVTLPRSPMGEVEGVDEMTG